MNSDSLISEVYEFIYAFIYEFIKFIEFMHEFIKFIEFTMNSFMNSNLPTVLVQ